MKSFSGGEGKYVLESKPTLIRFPTILNPARSLLKQLKIKIRLEHNTKAFFFAFPKHEITTHSLAYFFL